VGRITRSLFPPSKPLTVSSATVLVRLLNIWRRLWEGIFDTYHPEVNYMRGVGPKWREKHFGLVGLASRLKSSINANGCRGLEPSYAEDQRMKFVSVNGRGQRLRRDAMASDSISSGLKVWPTWRVSSRLPVPGSCRISAPT
jgi:hypothetical protein